MACNNTPGDMGGNMKSVAGKSYFFTNDEILTLRNAIIEYHQFVKNLKPNSPIAKKTR